MSSGKNGRKEEEKDRSARAFVVASELRPSRCLCAPCVPCSDLSDNVRLCAHGKAGEESDQVGLSSWGEPTA